MRTRTALPAVLLALAAATASCSSDSHGNDRPSKTPSAAPSRTYTKADCLALLERNYKAGTPQDVSDEAECSSITHAQYVDLVGQVLAGHKDEILDNAAWDTAWDGLDADAQANICALLTTDGPDGAEGLTHEQAQYFLDNKC